MCKVSIVWESGEVRSNTTDCGHHTDKGRAEPRHESQIPSQLPMRATEAAPAEKTPLWLPKDSSNTLATVGGAIGRVGEYEEHALKMLPNGKMCKSTLVWKSGELQS